jgi:hypothetical protein
MRLPGEWESEIGSSLFQDPCVMADRFASFVVFPTDIEIPVMIYSSFDYGGRIGETMVHTVCYISSFRTIEIIYDMDGLGELIEYLSFKNIKFTKYISFEIILVERK